MDTEIILDGLNQIAGQPIASSGASYQAKNPKENSVLQPVFRDADVDLIDRALNAAAEAFPAYRKKSAKERAGFLNAVADILDQNGESIIGRADTETALGVTRLTGELKRTSNQFRLFAKVVAEGSWVEARIDPALPDRQPLPRPDLRRMLMPLGPVVVFGASNFPLAFSVAGGDTASALAAACPVVVKAHPAHPGTSELVARAINTAAQEADMPSGVFSMLHGSEHKVGEALVTHPLTRAVAFTGSLRGGRALFDLAAARVEPIPVYAEMGSVNPVVLLPEAMAERGEMIAKQLAQSISLGTGQFCTNPGLVLTIRNPQLSAFNRNLETAIREIQPGSMLHSGIQQAFFKGLEQAQTIPGVSQLASSTETADREKTQAESVLITCDASTFLHHPQLREEIFGPASLMVVAESLEELLDVIKQLEGQLTATFHAADGELRRYPDLLEALSARAGRVIINGFPTGVEVSHAMHHGGPYPASSDARSTSVGTAAIGRFARPICYQDMPQELLPEELRDGNPLDIWRLVDGELRRDK